MSRWSPLLASSLASLLAASAACTLDPTGAKAPEGDGGAGPTTTAGPGSTSTSGPSSSSSSSSSSGEGGGTTSSSGGEGGDGGTGSQGGGGSGEGGAGGSGGGEGGGGPLDEWLTRVTGPDVQRVRDVAIDEANGAIYVVGVAKGSAVTLGDAAPSGAANDEDAFVARLDLEGAPVWMQVFGGAGKDQARSVAVGPGGRVFVAGVAEGSDAAAGDLFAGGLTAPPPSPWGWMIEIDPDTGLPEVNTGIPFGPIESGAGEAVDVAVTGTVAVAIATCTSSCLGADGRDLVAAGIDLGTGAKGSAVFADPGDQWAGAIAAVPGQERVVVTGRFNSRSLDTRVGLELGCATELSNLGGEDVFVAAYDLTFGVLTCAWSQSASGTGNDRADAVWTDGPDAAFVAARFQDAPTFASDGGPHAVKVSAQAGVDWATALQPGENGEALAITGVAADVWVGGRLAGSNDGYLVRLDAAGGAEEDRRVFSPGHSRTRAIAVTADLRIAVGELENTTDFLGGVGEITEDAIDGFVLRFEAP